MIGWTFVGLNYYGGQVWKHSEGWRAIECFTYYYRSRGYEITDENGKCLGICKTLP